MTDFSVEEKEIRTIIENWAQAVRAKDMNGILAHHADDIVMFDVPPPFQSKGIDAYQKTWDTFFKWTKDSGVFDILEMTVRAGSEVAFCYATMQCAGDTDAGEQEKLQFRLTIGLQKIDNQWLVQHEHHSIPSTE